MLAVHLPKRFCFRVALRTARWSPQWFRRTLLAGAFVLGACGNDYRVANGVYDAPADFCRLQRDTAAASGPTIASSFVELRAAMVTHRQTRLTVRSMEDGDPMNGRHVIVVSTAPDSAGVEVLHFAESDPGSGSSHRVAIADDGRSIYIMGSSSSKAPFVQAEQVLRLRIVPAERLIYRVNACHGDRERASLTRT